MTATFSGEVHPFADRFPMLDDDGLRALAEDIRVNGLMERLAVDHEGRLLDGRNRLAACGMAGVEPLFEVRLTDDPAAFIVSRNLQRRDLTQAQKAHLALLGLSDSDNRQADVAAVAGVPRSYVAEAAVVAEFAPDLVDAVITGSVPHSTAYDRAKTARARARQTEQRRTELEAKAPDLLAKLDDVDEAWAAYQERTREAREEAESRREASRNVVADIAGAVLALRSYADPDVIGRRDPDWLDAGDPFDMQYVTDLVLLRRARTGLDNLIAWMETR